MTFYNVRCRRSRKNLQKFVVHFTNSSSKVVVASHRTRTRKAKREPMIERNCDMEPSIRKVADRAIQLYAQGILTVEVLAERVMQEWEVRHMEEDRSTHALLMRMAQRICSRELYVAWCSPEQERRNFAFDNLRRYLENSLRQTFYAKVLELHANLVEDVLHQTLSNLCLSLSPDPPAGPGDPSAFLKWTRTILIRNAYSFLKKAQSEACVSLDAQPAYFVEQLVDGRNQDPQEQALRQEFQQLLKNAILSLKNPRYRQLLICTYLAGMSEREMSSPFQMHLQVLSPGA